MFYERRTVLIPHLRLLPVDRRRRPIELALIKKGSEFDVDRLFLPNEPLSSVEHRFQRPAARPIDSQESPITSVDIDRLRESVLASTAIPIDRSHLVESLKSARIDVARHDQQLELPVSCITISFLPSLSLSIEKRSDCDMTCIERCQVLSWT